MAGRRGPIVSGPGWLEKRITIAAVVLLSGPTIVAAQEAAAAKGPAQPSDILTPPEWQAIDRSVDRALAWLAGQQRPDGSFPTRDIGQPAVTALCVMAFMAKGHTPGSGKYGPRINAGIDYVLSCQKSDGLIVNVARGWRGRHRADGTANYNHAISGLMLSEVYGMTDGRRAQQIGSAITKAIQCSRDRQTTPAQSRRDHGGWRYHYTDPPGPTAMASDLSVTSWQLMFWRSAKNAGYDIPQRWLAAAVNYVDRCFDPQQGAFTYGLRRSMRHSRGMAGAGILAMALAGKHDTPKARRSAEWILRFPFDRYNVNTHSKDRYHYAVYYCTQAMFQLGGRYWKEFFPRLLRTLVANQRSDGSWQPEAGDDGQFGNAYTTALTVLALATPYQLLPIYQR